jgi:mRNA interferase MazF
MQDFIPDKGDVVWLTFNPQAGREQAGRRPALILSPQQYNKRVGLCITCPITSQRKGYPFEVELPEKLSVSGVVLSDHIRNVDWKERQAEFIGKVPKAILEEVIAKLNTLLA